jgi:benzil reductase ((S)-benzoin forming)
MRYFIITGTSSGLGEALAENAVRNHNKVFCISRRLNNRLKELGAEMHNGFWYFEQDLTDIDKIPALMNQIFSFIDPSTATEITLINNAGIVEPVGPLGKFSPEEIHQHITINLTAPVILSNEFIKESAKFTCRKNIVNISSGAAANPYYGWTLYCSTKAGLNMVTRTVGIEQSETENPVRIISVAPGVLDTGMQEKIRQVDHKDFPMKHKFEKLFDEKKLVNPAKAAEGIFELLTSDFDTNGIITDLRKSQ